MTAQRQGWLWEELDALLSVAAVSAAAVSAAVAVSGVFLCEVKQSLHSTAGPMQPCTHSFSATKVYLSRVRDNKDSKG